jgi:hypothetical protein
MRNTSLGSNRIVVLLTALLVAVGLTGLTTTAIAGDGQGGSGHHKHHHHKCPKGFHKKVFFKHGKKHRKCVKDDETGGPGSPSPNSAGLVINPTSFTFPDTPHNGTQFTSEDFVVTNKGGSASGVPVTSITEVTNPIPGNPAAFSVFANTCTAAVPAGGSCTVTVHFAPNDNQNGYVSTLHVVGKPGGDAQATLSGNGS